MLKNICNVTPYPTSCSLLVTEQCNLRCTYCFEKHNNNFMTEEVAIRAVEYLFENCIKNGSNDPVSVCFFGGEPTLNPKAIIAATKRGIELSDELDIRFNCSMITNCVVLPDELAEYFKKVRERIELDVQLSIDGPQAIQDKYRITPNGKGSYHLVEKTIEKWKEVFRLEDGTIHHSLHVHGCLNRDSLPHLYESFLNVKENFGLEATWFLPIAEEDWKKEDVEIYREQTGKILDYILNIVKENNSEREIRFHAPFSRFDQCTHPGKLCGAGLNYCSITAKGLVYPCHQYYFNDTHKETCIGDIFDKKINEHVRRFFSDYDHTDLTCKDNCPNVGCYRCIASNFTNNKSSIAQTRKFYCEFMTIDRLNQERIKKELVDMGLLSSKMTQYGRCDQHTSDISNGCDIVQNNGQEQHSCDCDGNCCDKQSINDNEEIFKMLLESIIALGRTVEDTSERIKELEKRM